jgi:uncharacterized protein (DUF1330 family)
MPNTLSRIDPSAVIRLARAELPQPLDVLNLIQLRDERSYARYGLAVAPALRAVGARLMWMGHLERTLAGESQAERLLVVRYPSQRRFLAMTLNPYYVLINAWRERGVQQFEAAFTFPEHEPLELGAQAALVVAQFGSGATLDRVRGALEPAAGPLVYASRMVSSASYLRGERRTDPRPLTFPCTAFFAASADTGLDAGAAPEGVAVGLYRRAHPRRLLEEAR